jgi:hypothetical protein
MTGAARRGAPAGYNERRPQAIGIFMKGGAFDDLATLSKSSIV